MRKYTTAYLKATISGDGETACALLGPDAQEQLVARFRENLPEIEIDSCADAVAETGKAMKGRDELREMEKAMEEVEFDMEIQGDKATGHAVFEGEKSPNEIELTKLDGEWRITGGFDS